MPTDTALRPPPTIAGALPHLLAANVAFDAVFGVFVVALVVLSVITLRWAVRRDRAGRAEWLRRQAPARDVRTGAPPPLMNGHPPRDKKGKRGDRRGQGPRGGGPRQR